MKLDFVEFEAAPAPDAAAADAGGEAAAAVPPESGESGDAAAVGAADAGAAEHAATPAAAPAPAPAIDLDSPEAEQRIAEIIERREQAAAAAQAQAAQAQDQQSQFAGVEEALGLLGIEPDLFKSYLNAQFGPGLAPLQEAAQNFQAQQAMAQVEQGLAQLATAHPDLLGPLDNLAELTNAEGQPVADVNDVRQQNQAAVLYAATALEQAYPGVQQHELLQEAAKQTAARDKTVGEIAVARYLKQLGNVAKAPGDVTGAAAAAGSLRFGETPGDEMAIAARFARENQ